MTTHGMIGLNQRLVLSITRALGAQTMTCPPLY
jgi:hypothetical protein